MLLSLESSCLHLSSPVLSSPVLVNVRCGLFFCCSDFSLSSFHTLSFCGELPGIWSGGVAAREPREHICYSQDLASLPPDVRV